MALLILLCYNSNGKQNNKQYIQYLLIDENYFDINGIHDKNSKVEMYITFNKKHNTIEFLEIKDELKVL